MKVLFIGGTGIISSACSELALKRGIDLFLFNRGKSKRPAPEGATVLNGDIRDAASTKAALGDLEFDAVVDWVAFTPDHVHGDLELFRNRTGQYIFISSASAYHKPPNFLPVTESTLLHNAHWMYSRNKAACEAFLMEAYRNENFPVTIVRPSHTYDRTLLPFDGGYTVVGRMRAGKKVIVHGDGTSLWTLTHHADFAVGLVGLLANPHAIGEDFHITSDEWLSWNQIFQIVADAAGIEPHLIHIPSDLLAAFDPNWGAGLLGDKAHSMIFDNSKIRRLVPDFHPIIPFWQGAREIMAWYDADPARRVTNPEIDRLHDRIIAAVEGLYKTDNLQG